MTDRRLRIAVLGAGGVGGLVGGLLARLGDEVTFLTSGPHAHELRERGITVRSALLGEFQVSVGVAAEIEHPLDACFVAVKAPDLEPSLRRILPAALGDALLVPLLNGIEHVELLRRLYPRGRVVAASIRVESTRTAVGRIEHSSPFVSIELGVRPDIATDVRRLGDHLQRAGVDVSLREHEAGLLWDKLAFLAPLALLTTIAGAPVGVVRTQWRDDLISVVDEVASVARADGAAVDPAVTLAALDQVPGTMTSSMQRDAAEGRTLELEAIGGSILRAAERTGVQVPVTGRLVRDLRARVSGSTRT
jgi:2-dehydropantoate 2-reductase